MEFLGDMLKDLTGLAPVLTLSLIYNIISTLFIKWLILADKEKTMHTKDVDDKRVEILTNKLLEIAGKK